MRTIPFSSLDPAAAQQVECAARRVAEAQQALRDALPKTTVAAYHEAQPTDEDGYQYHDQWDDFSFSIWSDDCWQSVAWTEKDPNDDAYAVWVHDENDNERMVGVYPADAVVYYEV